MKNYLLIITLLFSLAGIAQEVEKSTYFLIRHAEKDRSDKTNKNPNLTEKGKERAIKWADIVSKFKIKAVYSTNYNRTKQTAKPTADKFGLEIKTYHPFELDFENFLKETKGKNVLIVGHSNTTNVFTNKLIGSEIYSQIEDNNNANLYIVTIEGNKASHVLIKSE